jgi:hypothetical protein
VIEPQFSPADQVKSTDMELLDGGTVAHAYENGLGHFGADQFVRIRARKNA